jgi:hypothetical protein
VEEAAAGLGVDEFEIGFYVLLDGLFADVGLSGLMLAATPSAE